MPNTHCTDVDSGWAWMIFIAAFNVWFLWEGLLKSLSVLLPTLQEQFVTYTWIIGTTITLMASVREFAAVVVGILASTMSNQVLGVTGGILIGISLIVASFASDVTLLALCLSLVNGISFSLLMVPSFALLGQYFDRLYPLVAGLVYSGGSVGLMLFAPLAQFLQDLYGWRNTFLLLGALYFHLVISGILFRLPQASSGSIQAKRKGYNTIPNDNDTKKKSFIYPNTTFKEKLQTCTETIGIMALFRNRKFLAISAMMACTNATYTGWIVYFIPHCLAKGLTPYESSFVATAAGFAHLIGHVIYLPFLLKDNVRTVIYIACVISALSLFLDMFTDTFVTVLVNNLFYACGIGAAFPLGEVYMKSVVDKDALAKAFGWRMAIGGTVRIFPGFIVGWIYDHTGSYDAGFLLLGALQITGVLGLAADHLWHDVLGCSPDREKHWRSK